MRNTLENILAFSLLINQILKEYKPRTGFLNLKKVDFEMVKAANDDYIREKSKFYLGVEIGSDKLDFDRIYNLKLLSRNGTFDVGKNEVHGEVNSDISVLQKHFDYMFDTFGIENFSNEDMCMELEGESGKFSYPNSIVCQDYDVGYRIKGLHVHMSNFVLQIIDQHLDQNDLGRLSRKYTLESILR